MMVVLAMLSGSEAHAAQFCVNSQNAFQAALTTAQANGEDDVIRVVAGTYALTSALFFSSSEIRSLQVLGGFSTGCQAQTSGFSVLDGQDQYQTLRITNDYGETHVEHFSIQNGLNNFMFDGGGGMEISSLSGSIYVELCEFIGNNAGFAGALLAGSGTGTMFIRNNLVFGNTAGAVGGVALSEDSGVAFVVGNTVVLNHDTQIGTGGIGLIGNGYYALNNNILWNNNQNSNVDLNASAPHSRYSNDIGSIGGTAIADVVSGELSVDPHFLQCGLLCFSFALADDSPLIDAGDENALGGMTSVDLDFLPRKMGAHVDIGAFENDHIFGNGFE